MTAIANLPDLRPSLLLDFANSGRVDPRIQCTRASSATCFGPDGKLRTVAANVPRIDYDPVTGKCLGLLVEESRTNLRTGSRQPTNSTGTVVGTATAIAPDGLPITSMEDNPSYSGEHYVNDLTLAVTAGQVYTHSIFVKAMPGATRQVSLRTAASTAGSHSLGFNVSDTSCTVTSTPSYPYGIQKCQDGWWRVWAVFTAAADFATAVLRVQFVKGGTTLYQGEAGQGLFLFGRQIELGAFPTSYIPTEAAAVTRAADVPFIEGSWASGTVLQRYRPQSSSPPTGQNYFTCALNAGSTRMLGAYYNGNKFINLAGVTAGSLRTGSNAVAMAFGGGVAQSVANGGALTTGSYTGAVATHLHIGTSNVGITGASAFGPANGYIEQVAMYSSTLTAQHMQRLTA